jgi:membrane peptidoglycan carboxypeptidase
VGSPVLSEYNSRFGFNSLFDIGFSDLIRKSEINIPVLKSISPSQDYDKYSLAMHSCGLAPDKKNPYLITPLHAAMLAAAVANGGVMMKPYLVKEIRNVNGKIIYKALPQEYKRPVSPATAEKIKALMVDAVEKGIGQKAKVKGISIAGKTGTSSGAKGLNAWFISFAPADAPQYALAIVCDDEGKGMTVAAPIAGDIYKDLFK